MALDVLATLAALDADFAHAAELARRQRALADELGDPYHLAMAVKRQPFAEPGLRRARAFADEAGVLLRRCGSVWMIRAMLMSVIMVALDEGDYEAAQEIAEDGLRAAEEAGERFGHMIALGSAGVAALFLERMHVAEQRFREQLEICRNERLEAPWCGAPVLGLGAVAARAGAVARAAMLVGAAEARMHELMSEADRPTYERVHARFIAPARAALGDAAWMRAAATGAALTPEEVFALALTDACASTPGAGAVRPGDRR